MGVFLEVSAVFHWASPLQQENFCLLLLLRGSITFSLLLQAQCSAIHCKLVFIWHSAN
jgi:hypothetical protein